MYTCVYQSVSQDAQDEQVSTPGSQQTCKAILISGIAKTSGMESKIKKLKAKIENSPELCTHLVTELVGTPTRVKYTAKMLAVVALGGRPVVDQKWVDDSATKGEWEPEEAYVLKDEQNPGFVFSGSRATHGAKANKGKAKAAAAGSGGGGIFESLHFLRLEQFEYPFDDCKARECV